MTMQIVEKSGEGLSRVYGVTVPVQDLQDKLEAKISEVRPRLNLKGFRPGKVPAAHVKRMYGKALLGEIVEQTVSESQQQALMNAHLRPAAQPDVKVQSDLDQVLAGRADLAFELAVQVMPDFDPIDISTLALVRPVHTPDAAEVDAQLAELAEQNRTYEDKDGPAADGDMVVADFEGRIDGEAFEGGSAEGAEIIIGSGRFIPGFEAQLLGARAGKAVTVEVTFPEDYGAAHLAGKAATFAVTVKGVRAARETEVDDAFASGIGFDSLDALKEAVRNQVAQQYDAASRYKAKRALLDELDKTHSFPLPPRMVDAEFEVIWSQVEAERAQGELSPEDQGKSEEALRAEYRRIAERRVRLGLVLAEIGQRGDVQVTEQEMNAALAAEARRFPGQEREIFDFYRKTPQAAAQLRAPIYEEKVVDMILGRAQVADREVSREELFADDELPEGYGGAAEGDATQPDAAEAKPKRKAKAAEPEVQATADTADTKTSDGDDAGLEAEDSAPKAAKPRTRAKKADVAPEAAEAAAQGEASEAAKPKAKKPRAAKAAGADAE